MKGVLSAFLFILPVTLALNNDYTFEFGLDEGDVIYSKDDIVSLFHHSTSVDIPVPEGYIVTYVKVTVNALSPPKVDYDNYEQKVTIKYSWIQISQSSYTILVKGIRR